jgi:hypothetical protein
VSDHEDHTVADQLFCRGDRLFGIAVVVRRDELHPLTENAAGSIEVGHCLRRAAFQLLAEPGKATGNRASHADQDVRPRGPAERGGKQDNRYGDQAAHECIS